MTAQEIKDYIDRAIDTPFAQKLAIDTAEILKKALIDTKGFLDELEPKAKWVNNMNGTFTCSRCGAKRPNDNYCGNCGARMNDEVDDGSKD